MQWHAAESMHAAMHVSNSRPTEHAGELLATLLAASKGDKDDAEVASGGGACLRRPRARPRVRLVVPNDLQR